MFKIIKRGRIVLTMKKIDIKNKNRFIVLLIIILLVAAEFIRSNTYIQTENFVFESSKLPESFDGTKIVQISDYHNHGGSYDKRLLDEISAQNPDYIFLTGDIADSICTDIEKAENFLEKISEIAKCYLVWGNHDYDIERQSLDDMRKCASENNITVLENQFEYITKNNEKILITGTVNQNFDYEMMEDYPESDEFSVWLHHYPEDFEFISDISEEKGCKADLIFTGHAHGGLIRLPFIKGLFAPGQGFFPEYTSGEYSYNGSEMIVSRGVGNSGFTRRFLDPFHLVVCELKKI